MYIPESNSVVPLTLSTMIPHFIGESVDSLCRDDADMPMPPYICMNVCYWQYHTLQRV